MTISLRLNTADSELVKAYAEMNGISVSELLRRSVMERIEDEFDLAEFESEILSNIDRKGKKTVSQAR